LTNCLFVQIAIDSIRTHSHWTCVHRMFLKTRSYFSVRKIAPAIRFTQPFPIVRAVRYGPLSAQRFYFATPY
jgi:hypothetical protein